MINVEYIFCKKCSRFYSKYYFKKHLKSHKHKNPYQVYIDNKKITRMKIIRKPIIIYF